MKHSVIVVILALLLISIVTFSHAKNVRGYTKSNGTHVSSYHAKSPDSTVRNNYSYKGNANPYTQKAGTDYDRGSKSSEYYGTSKSSSGMPVLKAK